MTTTQGAIRRLELLLARTPDMECADDLRVVLADAVLSRRLLDDALAQKPLFWYRPHRNGMGYDGPISDETIEQSRRDSGAWVPLAPVPAQPSHFRARLIELCQPWTPANLDRIESCEEIVRAVAEGPHSQPAAAKGSTHCDDCGCDWLDNGLNPIGCPYCKRNNDKFNQCLNSLVRQCALMMDDCEEHADGTITIDCGISQGFLRRIYDLLSALEACGYDAIEPQPAAVPEAVAKDAIREFLAADGATKQYEGKWAQPRQWKYNDPEMIRLRAARSALEALLSTADTEVKKDA